LREVETAAALAEDTKTVISGGAFVDDIVSLVERLKAGMAARDRPWRAVIGIVRGGVFPAQRVAEALGIEYREISISYYRGTVRGTGPMVLKALADKRKGEGLLVVDDVIDSGGTAICVRRMLPRCDLAAIYTKPAGLSAVVSEWGSAPFCGRQMDDKWIVFPWDQPDWDIAAEKLIAVFREKISGQVPGAAGSQAWTDPDQGASRDGP
jgi:xanthine phosphoribosyltransferase